MPNLACAIKTTLNVPGSPAGEITHRQRKKFAAQKIEHGGVESHRSEREQIFLCERRELDENNRRDHAEQDRAQQSEIVFHDHFVDS